MSFYRNLLSSTGRKKNEPLCFTSLQDGSMISFDDWVGQENVFYISRDNKNWEQWDYDTIWLNKGKKVYIKGDNPDGISTKFEDVRAASTFIIKGKVECSGNIMSLLGEDITEISTAGCFASLFYSCYGLVSAPMLPATKLAEGCYEEMFSSCSFLISAPELPATKLAERCYANMFGGCHSLAKAPELPATELETSCYEGMFYACKSLDYISIKVLDWDEGCCSGWLAGVSEDGVFYRPLGVKIPRGENGVPECWIEDNDHLCITAVSDCNVYMWEPYNDSDVYDADIHYTTDEVNFKHWNGGAISLNAGSKVYFRGYRDHLSSDNARFRFKVSGSYDISGNIMSLVNFRKELKGADYCFAELFWYQNIINASNLRLPSTLLSRYCYGAMFICCCIEKAPKLPAVKLENACYFKMFYACDCLRVAPELPATELAEGCYYEMFAGCTSLKNIKVYFRDWTTNSFTNWVDVVGADGIFICPKELPREYGASRIPEGWKVINDPLKVESLCFTSLQDYSSIAFDDREGQENVFFISRDNHNWKQWDYSEITLDKGEKVYMIGDNPNGLTTKYEYTENASNFVIEGKVECSGNIMSLLGDDITEIPSIGCFAYLFNECKGIVSAPELPATELTDDCYYSMFYHCTSLVSAPELPATELKKNCYACMFEGCISLVNAPELPAKELAKSCYNSMFMDCTSLANAPELPATKLEEECYNLMFLKCTSLVKAPELPATELKVDCYFRMFDGCTSLDYLSIKALEWGTAYASSWLKNVSPTGTFKKPTFTDIPRGVSGIPEGWEVVNV